MNTIDDILKKSISGTTIKTPVDTGNLDSIFKASKSGKEADVFNFHSIVPPPVPVVPPKPNLINRVTKVTSDFIAGSAEAPVYTNNSWSQTFRNLPNEIVRTILPNAAALNDNPDLAAQVSNKDIVKEVPKLLFENFVAPLASFAQTFYGLTNKGLSKVGFNTVGGTKDNPDEVTWSIPGLGKVTNMQARLADDFAHNGVPQSKVGTAATIAKYTGTELLNGLFTASLMSGLVNPRVKTIANISPEQSAQLGSNGNTLGEAGSAPGVKSFQLYQSPTIVSPHYTELNPDFVEKLKGVGIDMSKYTSENPTYFEFKLNNSGQVVGKVVQVKPSFLSQFTDLFGGDIAKVPENGLTTLYEKSIDVEKLQPTKSGSVPIDTVLTDVKNNVKMVTENGGVYGDIKTLQASPQYPQLLDHVKTDAIQILTNANIPIPAELSKMTVTLNNVRSIPDLIKKALGGKETISIIPPASAFGINIPKIPIEEIKYKIDQIIPHIENPPKIEKNLPVVPDEHIIETAKNLAEQSGDSALMAKVKEAVALGEENLKQAKIAQDKLDTISEQSIQTPEKQLTEPVSIPYRPARVPPAQQVYANTPTSKFIQGTFEGKPYTSDSYIMEFNSNVQPPSKTIIIDGKKISTPKVEVFTKDSPATKPPTEEGIRKIIPNQEEAVSVKPVKVQTTENGQSSFVELEGDGVTLSVNQKYFDYFNKKYPNAVFMAVEPTRPIVVSSKGNMVGLVMPMNKDAGLKLKTTWEKPVPAQPKLKNPPATTGTKKTAAKKAPEKTETNPPALAKGELGSFASPKGNKTIRKIIERQAEMKQGDVEVPPASFKLSERAKDILDSFGIKVGEKSLSSRLLGVYKPLTEKVRVQALYDVTTVTHEAIHAIDDQIKFSEKLIADTGRGAEIRKRLTDIYEELYPNGKRTHPLKKRIQEGLSVFFENYFYDPASITAKYGDLVDSFIKPEGNYYNQQFTELLYKMNDLVDDYARLSPEERIGSRIRTGKEVVDQQTGFTWKQRIEYELFNRFEPLKRYAQESGTTGTWDDPMIQAFNILNKNSIITNWVKGKNTPILLKNGNFRIEEGSVADYLKMVKGSEKEFRSYLVARRVVAENNRLTELKNLSEEMRFAFEEEITKLENIIRNDDFSLQDASAVVEKYGGQFKEAVELYDKINKRLIDFSEETGLLDAGTADLYRSEKGYASFRRYIDEELNSVGTVKTGAKSKVTSFKERTGSQLDIIDPIYNQITSINEIIGKGMENKLWERVSNLANKNPEISQRFEKITAQPAIDAEGRVSFPQEKDPNIVRVFKDGKREFYKVAPEFGAISKQLRGKEFDAFVQLLRIPSSLFTRLTTSANPIFAVGNLTVDQFSALAQTKTGFKPIVDPAKSFKAYVTGDKGIQAYIAMGGKRQTLAAFYDLSPEDVATKLTGGETKLEKAKGVIDAGLGILELPSNTSEIMTRFSEYQRAVAAGDPMSVAMYKASEITTPFQLQGNIGGRFGQEVIKAIPYFNAAIQVFYKFGRSAKDNPSRMGSVIAGILTIGLTAAIMTYKSASEKQKRLLAEQPVRNLSNYLYFPSPDGENLIKIKIPQQMGVLSGMAYLYAAEHYGKNKATFDDYVDVISSSIPEQVQFYRPKNMLLSWLPQVIKPSIQVASNTKTFPEIGPIVPPYMVDKAPKEQYNTYTSGVSKTIGNLMGASPTLTEFWIRNQFGVVGGLAVGKLPSNPVWVQEKDFVMTGRSYNRFYENRTLVQQQYDEVITNDKKTQKYSQEEKQTVKTEHHIYDVVSGLLTEMRDINKTQDLPEDIKTSAYDVLLGIDSTKDIRDIEPDIRKLSDSIQNFKSKAKK